MRRAGELVRIYPLAKLRATLLISLNQLFESIASVLYLAPLHFQRGIIRPVSYYAFFKGLLLLSQPPGCIHSSTSFPTEHRFRDLS